MVREHQFNMAVFRMSEISHQHVPVLLREAVDNLMTTADGIYVDATFGRGSHSQAILDYLNPNGKLIAFDKDPEAVSYAKKKFSKDPRFRIFHDSYAHLQSQLDKLHVFGKIQGILFDLGVSSPQLDDPDRGFSFREKGKLDMRMDNSQGTDASAWLSKVDEKKLAEVLWKYGEEKSSRRIARAIVFARNQAPITTTTELSEIILRAIPMPKHKKFDKHPATRSFQAIRIAINEELKELEQGLKQALEALLIGGRLSVISFHSLEDRIVKQFIKEHEKGKAIPRGLPIKANVFKARLRALGKPIKPDINEVNVNPRARSAILRIAEKLS
jgi:16S rRNA (cytosine1402-N4)-methyltransferase